MSDVQLQPGRQTIRVPVAVPGDERTQALGTYAGGMDQMFINMIPSKQPDGTMVLDKRLGVGPGLNSFPALGTNANAKDNIVITQLEDVGVVAIWDAATTNLYVYQYRPAVGGTGAPAETLIGTIATIDVKDWVFLTELSIAGVPTLGLVWTKYDKSDSKGYYATSAGGIFTAASLTEISAGVDADFPANTPNKCLIGPFVQMDFTTYIMTTDGGIYNSDLNSITSWNALGVTASQAYPDKGMGICRYKHFIVAFGEDSIEFFSNAGNPPPESPLQRTDQAFVKFGTADPKLIRTVDDNLYWVSAGSGGTQGLWTLENFVPRKLTNRKQDNIITTAYGGTAGAPWHMHLRNMVMNGEQQLIITGLSNIYAAQVYNESTSFTDADDPVYPATFTHHAGMMAYNVGSQTVWYIMDMVDKTNGTIYWLPTSYQPISGGAALNKWLNIVFKAATGTGGTAHGTILYSIAGTDAYSNFVDYPDTSAAALDESHRVLGIIQLAPLDFGNEHRKFIHKMGLVMDFLYQSDVASYGDSKFYFFFAKDEYGGDLTKSFRRSVLFSDTNFRYYIKNLGSSRRWGLAAANWSGMPWRVKAFELDITQGVS